MSDTNRKELGEHEKDSSYIDISESIKEKSPSQKRPAVDLLCNVDFPRPSKKIADHQSFDTADLRKIHDKQNLDAIKIGESKIVPAQTTFSSTKTTEAEDTIEPVEKIHVVSNNYKEQDACGLDNKLLHNRDDNLNVETKQLVEKLQKYPDLLKKDGDGDTLLHLAIVHQDLNLSLAVILVIRQSRGKIDGINIQNDLLQTPLHLAVLTCQPKITDYLLQNGANIDAIDRNGQTALHLACRNADLEATHVLRKFSATKASRNGSLEVDKKNFEGLAPIHLASLTGSCEVVQSLLEMGADIDLKDSKSGRTALHHAVEAHNPIVTRFLLEKNADVDAQTFAGNTALHTASGCQMEDIVSLLLEFHADRMLKNAEGDLALPDASTVCNR
ncbi:B-cell lymphoma 3 protein-like isoform X2 [Xenia sp. Carnegie-2017]|uniref:B-cell lymphoma 3 protein-like isoform X2 n=1 Tax=Xenia sp. Carnegie-2017 TaxID=2897299 RepID=UPI001F04955C|nr:B-cell lymphoma 3 protein-like isoform X2 [Xenia sp. Carnegie-2017]